MEGELKVRDEEMYCNNCGFRLNSGMEVCINCGVRVGRNSFPAATKKSSVWLVTGGILGIIAGMMAIGTGIGMIVDGSTVVSHTADWPEIGFGISFLIIGLIAIIGSIFAINQKHFNLAIMGGICALWPMWFFGIPALILIAVSHREFDTISIVNENKVSKGKINEGDTVMENKYVWTAIAIAAMWLAVLFASVYGPDFEVSSAGGDTVNIPIAWGIAFFAMIGTVIVGIFGFRK